MLTPWITWLIIAAFLLVIEIFTGTVAFLCLSIGALVAIAPAVAGLSYVWQVVVFFVVAMVSFVVLRPLLKKTSIIRKDRDSRTNMDALLGRVGKVTHEITNNADDKGRVQIDGDSWLAYTAEPDYPIHRGEQVVVEAYDSIVLRVHRVA